MIIYKPIEIKWMITGYSNYGFGTNKSLQICSLIFQSQF